VGGLIAGISAADARGVTGLNAVVEALQVQAGATMVDTYNRRFHQTEAQKLDQFKAGKSDAEKHRLDAAASALVKCSAGVSTSDAQYSALQKLQKEGEGYTAELQILKRTGEFVYSVMDPSRDLITSKGEAIQRIGGGLNLAMGSFGVVGGAGIIAGGAVACPASLGAGCGVAAFGTVIAGVSAKQAYDGNKALWGIYTSSEGALVLSLFGAQTYPGEANTLTNAGLEVAKLAFAATLGKVIPKALGAAEIQLAKGGMVSTKTSTTSARSPIAGDEPYSPTGLSSGGIDHPVSLQTSTGSSTASLTGNSIASTADGKLTNIFPSHPPMPGPRYILVQTESGGFKYQLPSGELRTPKGVFDFVQIGYKIKIAPPRDDDFSGHLSLSKGADVDYAGTIQFSQKGGLKWWSNNSGHYQPAPENSSIVNLPHNYFKPEIE
jgi:hypothetical protein